MSNETELEVPSSRMAELVAAEARLPELELALRSIAEYELEVLNEIGAGVCAARRAGGDRIRRPVSILLHGQGEPR